MQAMDNDGDFWLEVSLVKNDRNNIYGTNVEDIADIRRIFRDFIEKGTLPDMTGWEFVGGFDRDSLYL